MRLILVDSETELIHCDFPLPEARADTALERLCVRAAAYRDAPAGEQEYAFGPYRPYCDHSGYFAFLVSEQAASFSPTTLAEVMSRSDYVGYVRETRRHAASPRAT